MARPRKQAAVEDERWRVVQGDCIDVLAELDAESVDAIVTDPPHGREKRAGVLDNEHPTVKPVDLMLYLIRLVTPPGGLVVDPFTGSGSTGVAAVTGGFRFLGIERESKSVDTARARISDRAFNTGSAK